MICMFNVPVMIILQHKAAFISSDITFIRSVADPGDSTLYERKAKSKLVVIEIRSYRLFENLSCQ